MASLFLEARTREYQALSQELQVFSSKDRKGTSIGGLSRFRAQPRRRSAVGGANSQ